MFRSKLWCAFELVLALLPSWVNAQNCKLIHNNPDDLNYCKSIEKGERKYCKKIISNDKQNLCLGKADNNKNFCNEIKDVKMRKHCMDSMH
jgi:hypothetical protein